MPTILLCAGISPLLEGAIDEALHVVAGDDNHACYFAHPLRNVPVSLLPLMTPESEAATLLTSQHQRFLTTSSSILHQRNLLDEWITAVKNFTSNGVEADRRSGSLGEVILVVDALRFKAFERWATSRKFPVQDLVSNGRTLESDAHAALIDVDLALQHLRRKQSTLLTSAPQPAWDDSEDYLVAHVCVDPVWFLADACAHDSTAEHQPLHRRIETHLNELQRVQRETRSSIVVGTASSLPYSSSTAPSASAEGKTFLIQAHAMQELVRHVEAAQGNLPPQESTVLGAIRSCFRQEEVREAPVLERPLAVDSALSEYSHWLRHNAEVAAVVAQVASSASGGTPSRVPRQRKGVVYTRSYARVGLMGNPSDQLHGKSIAVSIENFWADVALFPTKTVRLIPNPVTDPVEFGGLADLFAISSGDGYSGGLRIIQAILKRFFQYCTTNNIASPKGIALGDTGFTIAYDTNVPRQVGLAGSSCIITAVLKAVVHFFQLADVIRRELLPSIALSAEVDELGIHAGLMDRVVQMYDGCVLMDFTDRNAMQHHGHATYERVPTRLLPALHLAYAIDPSDSGKKHSTVKQRWLQGDPEVIAAASYWASLVDQLVENLRDTSAPRRMGELMDKNFDLRRKLYGDASLGWKNLRMIEIARSHGASAKFPGSGGAILIYADPSAGVNLWQLKKAMYAEGFVLISLALHHANEERAGAEERPASI